jgi:hypothetical protein
VAKTPWDLAVVTPWERAQREMQQRETARRIMSAELVDALGASLRQPDPTTGTYANTFNDAPPMAITFESVRAALDAALPKRRLAAVTAERDAYEAALSALIESDPSWAAAVLGSGCEVERREKGTR